MSNDFLFSTDLPEPYRIKTGKLSKIETRVIFKPTSFSSKILPGDKLFISYAVKPEFEKDTNKKFSFNVFASSNSAPVLIFGSTKDPSKNLLDRGWHSAYVPLRIFEGSTVQFTLRTEVCDENLNKIHDGSNSTVWGQYRVNPFIKSASETNVILISLDTLRADRLSFNGYSRLTSPQIDQIAKQGVVFKEAISQAPWTLPSHMSVFTGLYPSQHGMTLRKNPRIVLSPKIKTLTEFLREKGYATQAITGSGFVSSSFGFYRGFESFIEFSKPRQKDAQFVFGNAMKWLEENYDKKFFLFLHTYEIHRPFTHRHFLDYFPDSHSNDDLNSRYDSGIRYVDTHIGLLRKKLEELNLIKDTLIVIFSDHGEDLGSHYPNGKHGHILYDVLIKVPLIFFHPEKILPKSIKNLNVELIDIFPTILELIGATDVQTNIQGKSLVPYITDNNYPKESWAFSESISHGPERKSIRYNIRKKQYKLIIAPGFYPSIPISKYHPEQSKMRDFFSRETLRDVKNHSGLEFYDLTKDPHEKLNKKDTKNKTILNRMKMELEKFITNNTLTNTTPNELKEIPSDLIETLRSLGY